MFLKGVRERLRVENTRTHVFIRQISQFKGAKEYNLNETLYFTFSIWI